VSPVFGPSVHVAPSAWPGSASALHDAAARASAEELFWWALGLAAALRLMLLLGLGPDVQQTSDARWYLERAHELLATGQYSERGLPTAFWPVGYPAFLAGVMAVFGTDPLVGQAANAVLGVLAVWLLHRWCLLQFGCPRVAGLAALLLAVYPNHLGYTVGLYSEPLYTVLLLAVAVVARQRWGDARWVLAGALAGAATLVKSQTLLLAPLLLALLVLPHWRWAVLRRRFSAWLLALVAMAAVVAPWTMRNWVVMGAPVPVSTNAGMSLLIANNDGMHWGQDRDYHHGGPVFRQLGFTVRDQVAVDRHARELAWQWMADNPGRVLALFPWKVYRQWAYDGEAEWWFQMGYAGYEQARPVFRALRVVNQVFYGVLLLLGLAGLWRVLRLPGGTGPRAWVLPLLLLFFTALCTVFSGQSRYHYPLVPFIWAYAAWWWVDRRDRAPAARRRPGHRGAAVAARR
jgi:4-amino-4-deoxy-L-arabinose transferase-like glycosyltransferase